MNYIDYSVFSMIGVVKVYKCYTKTGVQIPVKDLKLTESILFIDFQ